jgi:hypothetical protein
LIFCLYALSVVEASNQLRTAENRQFEIVGLDLRSVAFVDELSLHVEGIARRYLESAALEFPQRILIRLKPEKYVEFAEDYEIRIEEGGFVSLDMRWSEKITLRTATRGIAEALLVRYALFNHGPGGVGFLPDWPGAAIGTQAYLSLRPAEFAELGSWLDQSATPTLGSLLARKWSDSVIDANAYCFLLAMERSGFERSAIRILMAQAIAGIDILEALEAAIQPGDPTSEPISVDQWWTEAINELPSGNRELFESMELSRLWIDQLAGLGDLGDGVNLRSLWQKREEEETRRLIKARYQILRIRLGRVNPAYFNSAKELGALFETFLYGERSHEYVHRLAIFLSEFEDTKQLETVVRQALSEEN